MKKQSSSSVKILHKKFSHAKLIPQNHTSKNKGSNIQLPKIHSQSQMDNRKSSVNSMLINLSKSYSMQQPKTSENSQTNNENMQQKKKAMILEVKQKSKLLRQLKQKILQLNDNLLVKKILSQIKYSSLGRIATYIWNHVDYFQNCDEKLINRLQIKFEYTMGEDFLKCMNFINNICRFLLADYKKKMWNHKQKQISGHFIKINQDIGKVMRNIQQVQSTQTKLQIISSIKGMKQECFANKQRYMDWKQKAIQKLKQNSVHCQILRAQIFTEQFI